MRGAVADVTVKNNEGWAMLGLAKDSQCLFDPVDVIGVADAQYVPAVAQKSGRDVLGKGDARIAFDRDVIVVVDPAKVVQGEMARQRRRFGSHALHHAAVAANRVDVVVEDLEVGAIVPVSEPRLGNGHADAVGDALSKRSSRGLDTRNQVVLGMTRSFTAELAKVTNIVERNRGLPKAFVFGIHRLGASEVKYRPQQHRGMTVRKHESIPVRPDRILRIEA